MRTIATALRKLDSYSRLLLVAVLLCTASVAGAQTTYTGVVRSTEDNQPLPRVSVQVKGTSTTVITSENGTFSIMASNAKTMPDAVSR